MTRICRYPFHAPPTLTFDVLIIYVNELQLMKIGGASRRESRVPVSLVLDAGLRLNPRSLRTPSVEVLGGLV